MITELPLTNGGVALVDECDFHWLSQRGWYDNGNGYAVCDLSGRRGGIRILMHRLIMLAPDTATVDHRDGCGLHNWRDNLRLATQSEQNANRPKFRGKSNFKGVHRRSDGLKWVAQIRRPNREALNLGSFANVEDAARAYDAAARELYGEFAALNFPLPGERNGRPHTVQR